MIIRISAKTAKRLPVILPSLTLIPAIINGMIAGFTYESFMAVLLLTVAVAVPLAIFVALLGLLGLLNVAER